MVSADIGICEYHRIPRLLQPCARWMVEYVQREHVIDPTSVPKDAVTAQERVPVDLPSLALIVELVDRSKLAAESVVRLILDVVQIDEDPRQVRRRRASE